MAENEKTSKKVATIASEILKMNKPYIMTDELWEDIKTLAGSALTQAPDKPVSDTLADRYAALKRLNGFNTLGKKDSLSPSLFMALHNLKNK